MPTESTDDSNGQLNKEQVALALQNVSHLFGDEAGSGSAKEVDTKHASSNKGGLASVGSTVRLSGRNRVDSTARPPQFMQNNNAKKGKLSDLQTNSKLHEFRDHGINEGALRHRMASKAIDEATIQRVRTDFGPHDKLSEEELESLDALVTKAHKLHVDKDDAAAEALYNQVLQADPVNYDCLSNLAKIAYSRGQLQQAHDLFERAIVVRPQHDKTVYHLAVVLYDLKQQERSKSLFEEVVQGYKGENKDIGFEERCDAKTYHNSIAMLGLIHQNLGDLDKARILYSTVLKADPEHVLTLDHKCSLLAVTLEHEEASKLHKKVCLLDPSHTKKACPYLDSLFPRSSTLFHEQNPIESRLVKFEKDFACGARKKSWTNHPWRSLMKKMTRAMGKGPPRETDQGHAREPARRV